jgi:putative hydrolase of the HAD superfamily
MLLIESTILNKRLIVIILSVSSLLALSISGQWWMPILLEFAGTNPDAIQLLSQLAQIIIGFLSLVVATIGVRRMPGKTLATKPLPDKQKKDELSDSNPLVQKQLSVPTNRPITIQLPPLPVSKPVGRGQEIQKVFNALKSRSSVAITGIAGVGKSTVLAVAIRKISALKRTIYTDICFHRIVERDSSEERLRRLLSSLIIALDPLAKMESADLPVLFVQAQRLMVGRRVLLAIDNVDDADSYELVQNMFTNLPQITLAVTSRRMIWQNFNLFRLDGMIASDCVKLFELTFEDKLDETGKQAVASLCEQVQGHPMMITHLALEAKAGHLRPNQLQVVYAKLGIDRALSKRFDFIYDPLPENCRKVIQVIGILDTATLRADLVQEVTQVSMRDLEQMEDQYMIHFHPDKQRFTVHELVKKWCRSKLKLPDEYGGGSESFERIPFQIAEYYIQFLKKHSQCTPKDLAEIDQEWPNILGLTDRISDQKIVLTLVDEAIGDHFDDPNGYVPNRKLMESILTRGERLLSYSNNIGGLLAARIEKNIGHFFYWRGDYERAEALFLQARDRYKAEADIAGEVATTWLLGYIADDENRYLEAQTLYENGTKLAEHIKPYNTELIAAGHHLIGCTLYHQGRFQDAETEFLRAVSLIDKDKALHLAARIKRRLGSVALGLGRFDEAENTFYSVANLVDQLGRPRDAARIARHLGVLNLLRDDLSQAEEFLQRALSSFKELKAQRGIGYTLHALAVLRRKQGRLTEAKDLCQQSLNNAKQANSLYGEAVAYEELANIFQAQHATESIVNSNLYRACNIYTIIGHRRSSEIVRRLKEIGAMPPELPNELKGTLFDLMDTLAYMQPGVYEKTHQNFARHLGVSMERFQWAWTHSREQASTGIFKTTRARILWVAKSLDVALTSDEQCNQIVEEEEAMWRDSVKLYDEAIPLLESVRKLGLHLAIVSNGPVAMACLREALGLSLYVDAFILSSHVGVTKPNQLIYTRATDSLRLQASQCVFVGDGNDHELDGARQVGMYTIKINRPSAPYTNLKKSSLHWDMEVKELQELKLLFESKRGAKI